MPKEIHSVEEYTKEQMESRKNFSLTRLYKYALPYWPKFLIVFFLIIISTMATLAQPKIIQILLDHQVAVFISKTATAMQQNQAVREAAKLGLYYFLTVCLAFFGSYFQAYILQSTGQKILLSIRQNLYDHILRLPMKFFDHYPLGSLVTRVTNDTETLNEMFTSVLSSILKNLFALGGIIAIMFSMNAKLAGMIIILVPLIALVSVIFKKAIRKIYFNQRRLLSIINTKLSENISGMRTIQIFHRQKQISKEFDAINQEYLKSSRKEVRYYAFYRPSIEIVRSLGIAALIWFGGVRHLEGLITFGVLTAFIDYIQHFFQPILQLAETYNLVQSAVTSTSRIFRLLDEPEETSGGEQEIDWAHFAGKIEFKNVWFSYLADEWVLKDVSFEIMPGQFVAFVGSTGAGKSTIMHLLCRFYDVQKGLILIDGRDIKEYKMADLRKAIGVVQQDVFLYSGNILNNITLNRAEVSERMARTAAEIVNAHSFIEKLPRKYQQYVTERGSTLSAGQRQLLAFARTIATEPPLLILDEATANIDTETEILIQDAIRNMAKARTMLAVAHRISTIADADKIIVLHHGRVAEQGTREELLAQDGLFKVLYQLQYENQV